MMIRARSTPPETARFALRRRFTIAVTVAALTFVAAPHASLSAESPAGQANIPAQRVVHGRVEDKGGAVVKGAVVYLKDDRSSQVKSAISLDDGTYRFVQLAMNNDYELWAQAGAQKSKTKSISSFDSKADITIDLKID